MQNVYHIERDGECLTAKLMENEAGRTIGVVYSNSRGDKQVSQFKRGSRLWSTAELVDGSYPIEDTEGNTYLAGNGAAYRKLGPELREQIPQEWHVVLGSWLTAKEK